MKKRIAAYIIALALLSSYGCNLNTVVEEKVQTQSEKVEDQAGQTLIPLTESEEKVELQVEKEKPVPQIASKKYQANAALNDPNVVFINGIPDPRTIDPKIITELDKTTLINKYNALPDDYCPQNLVSITTNGDEGALQQEAAEAWNRLEEKAASMDIHLVVFSSIRSREIQEGLFNRYLGNDSSWAIKYSAYPRRSEHELGLAVDVSNYSGFPTDFESSPQGKFMEEYGADFGFILRYPKDKEEITGYAYESWHFRYLGVELAKELKEKNLTLEEYYGLHQSAKSDPSSSSEIQKNQEPLGKIMVVNEFLNVREQPSLNARLLGKIYENEEFNYYEESQGWYRIVFEDQDAWISGDYVELVSDDN